jgi:hypothetical protein
VSQALGSRSFAAGSLLLMWVAGSSLSGCSIDEEGICAGECGASADATLDARGDTTLGQDATPADRAQADVTGSGDAPIDVTIHDDRRAPRDGGRDARDAREDRPTRDADAHADHPGCKSPTDCDAHEACNLESGVCSSSCSAAGQCNGGCCDGLHCDPGDAAAACGSGGALCAACEAVADSGAACLASGTCGCLVATDCPTGQACNGGVCNDLCTAAGQCNGGCCDGVHCQPGTAPTACGTAGAACSPACSGFCSSGACAPCTAASQCPVGSSCNTTTGTCSTTCSFYYYGGYGGTTSTFACNGGCCDWYYSHACQPGNTDATCGNGGANCNYCTLSCTEPACVGGALCGCTDDSQCGGGYYCPYPTCHPDAGGAGACGF